MTHEIKNQHGKHIIDQEIRNEINYALDHAWTYTYFDNRKIEIVSDYKDDKGRVTIVSVEV